MGIVPGRSREPTAWRRCTADPSHAFHSYTKLGTYIDAKKAFDLRLLGRDISKSAGGGRKGKYKRDEKEERNAVGRNWPTPHRRSRSIDESTPYTTCRSKMLREMLCSTAPTQETCAGYIMQRMRLPPGDMSYHTDHTDHIDHTGHTGHTGHTYHTDHTDHTDQPDLNYFDPQEGIDDYFCGSFTSRAASNGIRGQWSDD